MEEQIRHASVWKNPLVILAVVVLLGAIILAVVGYLNTPVPLTVTDLDELASSLPEAATTTYSVVEIDEMIKVAGIQGDAITEDKLIELQSGLDLPSEFATQTRWQAFVGKLRGLFK